MSSPQHDPMTWTNPGTGQQYDLNADYTRPGEDLGDVVWRHNSIWLDDVPVLAPVHAESGDPVDGHIGVQINTQDFTPATGRDGAGK